MSTRLSGRASVLTSSAIREILKVTEDSAVISFAGGIPSPLAFPVDAIKAALHRVMDADLRNALQYSRTEGYGPLREWVANRHGVSVDQVLITTGSQQALDLLAKALIDPGSAVLVESPTYLGALQAFSLFGARYLEIPCDEEGVLPDELDANHLNDARLAYLMPNFQNPTGLCIPLERRHKLIKCMADAGILIIEDDPYQALRYTGTSLPSLHSLYPEGVAYLGSFSKVLAPGLRLGYVIAPPSLLAKLVQIKQAADLHSSSFDQRLAFEVVRDGFLDSHIDEVRRLYAERCRVMLNALAREMPSSVSWSRPCGGMFVWVRLAEDVNSADLLTHALQNDRGPRVAFVPGPPFFAGAPQANSLRLSFATVGTERIHEGIGLLAQHIRALTPVQQF